MVVVVVVIAFVVSVILVFVSEKKKLFVRQSIDTDKDRYRGDRYRDRYRASIQSL